MFFVWICLDQKLVYNGNCHITCFMLISLVFETEMNFGIKMVHDVTHDTPSLKTDLRFAALKFAGGIERRNVGLTKMFSTKMLSTKMFKCCQRKCCHREMSCDWLVADMKGLELV